MFLCVAALMDNPGYIWQDIWFNSVHPQDMPCKRHAIPEKIK
jgi:hypothetical protein